MTPPGELSPGIDLIWIYGGNFDIVPSYAERARAKRIPILVNSSYDGTSQRTNWIIQSVRAWDPDDTKNVFVSVFTHAAEFDPAFRSIRDQIISIPKTLRCGTLPLTPFEKRDGICIGELAKTFRSRLTGKLDTETIINLLPPDIPVVSYAQYGTNEPIPKRIVVAPYQDDMLNWLGQFRLFLSLISFETFTMVPLEAQSVGTPVLYRHMPQSLSQYIGHTGFIYRNEEELLGNIDALYNNKNLWERASQMSVHNAQAHQVQYLAVPLYLSLQQVIHRFQRKANA
jgi:hypothetical protein